MAEEKTQFHQGWLYAREDGLQFAPYTVTEGIYNQNGTLLSNDISSLKSKVNTNTSNISTNTGKINNNTESISTLQTKVNTNTSNISTLQTKTEYMDASARNAFYVIDPNKNIIAMIDANGVKSVDFIVPDVVSLAALGAQIGLQETDNTFYIVDASGNVVFQVDSTGAKSIDFILNDENKTSLLEIATKTTDISYSSSNKITSFANNVTIAKELDVNTIKMEDEIFYFTDASGNIIAQVDGNGVSAYRSRVGTSKMDCIAYQKVGTVTY